MPDFRRLVDDLSPALLRWAYGKTDNAHRAEDLAQEVWLQFFSAVAREERMTRAVENPEHLLWKVAKFVWLKSLRKITSHQTLPLDESHADPLDFAERIAEEEERVRLQAWVRQHVVNLNRLQREAFILYYVEQVPQKEIAHRLGVSEGTLRWHLFETRKKLRKGANDMNTTEFSTPLARCTWASTARLRPSWQPNRLPAIC